LSDEEFNALVDTERDAFKLAILGFAALEAEFVAEIEQAFGGAPELPAELKTASWKLRLGLAVAFGLLPAQYRPLFDRLATVRHRFAHGEIHELSRQLANTLADAALATLTQTGTTTLRRQLAAAPPLMSLRTALIVARALFQTTAGMARGLREQDLRIVARHRMGSQQRSALVRLLLDETGTSSEETGADPD